LGGIRRLGYLEIEATRTTFEQMAMLRQKGVIDVDFQFFGKPFGERLRTAGVAFRAVGKLSCDHPMELMSVVPGYPCAIRACFDEDKPLKHRVQSLLAHRQPNN
jgi:hypothetical protein